MSVKIRGGILLARHAFVVEHFGEKSWQEVLGTLSNADRQFLSGMLLQIGWYPFEVGERLDQAIVKVLGKGDVSVFESIGAMSAIQNLAGAQKLFIENMTPGPFMRQAGLIYKFYYNVGRREYKSTSPVSGILTTYDAETFSEMDCLTVIGWYKEALKMCGAKTVTMVEKKCRAKGADVCEYEVSWTG